MPIYQDYAQYSSQILDSFVNLAIPSQGLTGALIKGGITKLKIQIRKLIVITVDFEIKSEFRIMSIQHKSSLLWSQYLMHNFHNCVDRSEFLEQTKTIDRIVNGVGLPCDRCGGYIMIQELPPLHHHHGELVCILAHVPVYHRADDTRIGKRTVGYWSSEGLNTITSIF